MYRDFIEGEDAVKSAGEVYLPRPASMAHDADGDAEYGEYIARAEFFNAVSRTLDGLHGLTMRKPVAIDIDDVFMPFFDDVDGRRNSLDRFASDLVYELLAMNRCGGLVDAPSGGEGLSLREAEEKSLSAFMALYRAEDIINWHYAASGRRNDLDLVVLRERYEERGEDAFSYAVKSRYRVLYLDADGVYTQALYTGGDEEPEVLVPKKHGRPLNHIPFYVFGGAHPRKSMLEDLIFVNKSWYQLNADYKSGLHYTAVPVPYSIGFTPKGVVRYDEDGAPHEEAAAPIRIRSSSFVHFPEGCTGVGMLEFGGSGMGALRQAMADDEDRMAILGARIISQERKGVEAAETARIHRAGENSVLARAMNDASDTLSAMVDEYVEWRADVEEVDSHVHINTDFDVSRMSAADLTAVMAAWQGGLISKRTAFANIKEGEVVDASKTFDEEQSEIDEEQLAGRVPPPENTDDEA